MLKRFLEFVKHIKRCVELRALVLQSDGVATVTDPREPGQRNPYVQNRRGVDGQSVTPLAGRRNVVIAAVVALLVLAGCGVGMWLVTDHGAVEGTPPGGGERTNAYGSSKATSAAPRGTRTELAATAKDYVDAVNRSDEAAAIKLTCRKKNAGTMYASIAGEATAVTGDVVLSERSATVGMIVEGGSGRPIPLPFAYENGAWCVAV